MNARPRSTVCSVLHFLYAFVTQDSVFFSGDLPAHVYGLHCLTSLDGGITWKEFDATEVLVEISGDVDVIMIFILGVALRPDSTKNSTDEIDVNDVLHEFFRHTAAVALGPSPGPQDLAGWIA